MKLSALTSQRRKTANHPRNFTVFMKTAALTNFRQQERNLEAFLFSTLVHVFIFTSVSFIFSNLMGPPKPTFIFLGPILGYEEIQNFKGQTGPGDPGPTLNTDMDIPIRTDRTSFYPVLKSITDKALFTTHIPEGTRTYLKNPFLEEKSRVQMERAELQKLGIDPGIPRRVPLRLSY